MGLLFSDGFDTYSATADLSRNGWIAVGTNWAYNATAGRTGGGAIVCSAPVANSEINFPFTTGGSIGLGLWFKITGGFPSASTAQFFADTGSATFQNYIRFNSGIGQLTEVPSNGNSAPQLLPTNVCDGGWHWIEIYWPIASGTCKIYIDTLDNLPGHFANFTNNGRSKISFSCPAGLTMTIDDLFVYDDSAPSPRVSTDLPLGMRTISTIRPNGDNTVAFTPNTGSTNYTQVNEASSDGDTSYVEAGNSGVTDLYNYGDLPYLPASVTALSVVSSLRNPGAGSINFKNTCKSGATTSDGTSTLTPPTYATYQRTAYNQDPNTSAAWTAANVNSALFGIKVV